MTAAPNARTALTIKARLSVGVSMDSRQQALVPPRLVEVGAALYVRNRDHKNAV
jgi:hypothetical protein